MTDQELLLLNNIMYLKKLNILNERNSSYKIGELLKFVGPNELKRIADDTTSAEDWGRMIQGMKENMAIAELELVDFHVDRGGGEMACFKDPSGNAVAVFQGTSTQEWSDNFQGGYVADTPQQKSALEWIDSLPYENITVTGHSKGGNKAQYVSLLSDKVDRCVSYDGQGFSKEFLEKYEGEVAVNRDKITSYAVDNDYVNILLYDVSGEKIYLKGNNVDVFIDNHCPDSAFFSDGSGNLVIHETEQGEAAKKLQGLLNYILNTASDTERRQVLNLLGDLVQMTLGDKKGLADVVSYLFRTENVEVTSLFFAYVYRYEKESDGLTDAIRHILRSLPNMDGCIMVLDAIDWLSEIGLIENFIRGHISVKYFQNELGKLLGFYKGKYFDFLLQVLYKMLEKQGKLPYSEELTKSIFKKEYPKGNSRGFTSNLIGMSDSADRIKHLNIQLKSTEESIRDIRKSISKLEGKSFHRVLTVLKSLEGQVREEQFQAEKMGSLLKHITGLYGRAEKRITSG